MTHSFGKDGRIESSLFHSREWWAQQFRMKVRVWSQEASTSKGRLNLLAIAFLSTLLPMALNIVDTVPRLSSSRTAQAGGNSGWD